MKPKITLNHLIDKINNPEVVRTQLELYNDWMEAEYEYDIKNLIPILNKRLKEVANTHSEISANHKNCTSVIENMADKSLGMVNSAASLYAVFLNLSYGEALAEELKDIESECKTVCIDAQSFMLKFLEQDLEGRSVNLTGLNSVLGKLNEMLLTPHFNTQWAKGRLHSVHCDIQKYYDDIAGKQFQPLVVGLYKQYLDIAIKAEKFQGKLFKKKSVNPQMISNEEIALCSELNACLEQLGTLIHKVINALGQHEQLLLVMVSRLKVYLLLSDKLGMTKVE